ncbi:M3 family metallopeptidase [Riemerella columbipharyngis]|uniref:Peptidyl-dipeptidase Dcp n=1 Tax=Riemerella columbipharyngis TaxID=1071918 RepID=A0A1G7AVI4_9FLAO|nr:M3 family metallopeptidase [Riemerella columbipharyngis]SDE18015.1 peptidyl-dipeptidase Dcp [Riemerella columbipharyngis]
MKNISTALFYASLACCAVSCSTMKTAKDMAEILVPAGNPFLQKSPLQDQAPQFDKIKDSDFKPAFDYGLKVQDLEIKKIADNPMPATFENTVLALEKSGRVLKRAQITFDNLTSANTNDALQKLQEEYAPIFAAHNDNIYLNSKLYNRIKKVYENRVGLDPESKRLVEYFKQEFETAGANLSDSKKDELKKINAELASLSSLYANKLLLARKNGGVLIKDVKELDGLSPDEIAATAADAKAAGYPGEYLIALQNTTQQPLLKNLKNRETRKKLFMASVERAQKGDGGDTRETIEKIIKLRLKKAQLLGKDSYAAWSLQDQMARTPDAVFKLLSELGKPAIEQANREAVDIQKVIDAQNGGFKVEPWDWNYYAEQVRKQKFNLDENEIKPYFELKAVLEKGVFFAANKFYGISFKQRTDLPVYNLDVWTYEIFDKDGKSLGLYYVDYFTRDNKNGGAWMTNLVNQSKLLGQKPVIINVCNFQKPAPGKPALISFDDVITMFHEFGHMLHGLFADEKYETLSGTSVPRDFVEFPSQFNENFALVPEVLKNYAVHYETHQPIPQSLVDKIKKAVTFNQGYATTEVMSSATLDMALHSIKNEAQFKPVLELEKEALQKYGFLVPQVPPRYHTPYFAHIFGGGYAAGYYAYIWTALLQADAWDWVMHHGGMTRENGDRYRKYILSIGNTKDLNEAYREFSGRNPEITSLLRKKGFVK